MSLFNFRLSTAYIRSGETDEIQVCSWGDINHLSLSDLAVCTVFVLNERNLTVLLQKIVYNKITTKKVLEKQEVSRTLATAQCCQGQTFL